MTLMGGCALPQTESHFNLGYAKIYINDYLGSSRIKLRTAISLNLLSSHHGCHLAVPSRLFLLDNSLSAKHLDGPMSSLVRMLVPSCTSVSCIIGVLPHYIRFAILWIAGPRFSYWMGHGSLGWLVSAI